MPKLAFKTRTHLSDGGTGETVAELILSGFIDAANYLTFEKALEEATGMGTRCLLVDFSRVDYINSTGISGLIRSFETLRERDGLLCLAGVARPVGLSMHLLGVTSFLPFAKDLAAGRQLLAEFLAGDRVAIPAAAQAGAESAQRADGSPARPKVVVRQRPQVPKGDARVLVLSPRQSRFTRVLRLRLEHLNGGYFLLHDSQEALRRYDEIHPDLVVVDDRCDRDGEFVSRIKVQKGRSLTSVIKIYEKGSDVEGSFDFKIWENDYLVDPFEVLELFTLTEAELLRVPRDRKVFTQQVHFEFRTTQANIDKAYRLSEVILRHAIPEEEEATAMYAAVKEGIDNAVAHGNLWEAQKTVDVNFLVDQTKVTVIIEDEGKGFDYEYYLSRLNSRDAFEEAKRRIVQEKMRGGLGILLMSRCADRIQYGEPGNALRLEKNIH